MGNELIVYEGDGFQLDVPFDPDRRTIWLTQRQIAQLLDLDISAVSRHVNNYRREAGDEGIANFAIPTAGGVQEVEHYSLEVLTFVGYRAQATPKTVAFRRWAEQVIKEKIESALKPLDPLEQLKLTVAILEQQQAQLTAHEGRIEVIETRQTAMEEGERYFSIVAYAKLQKVAIDDRTAQSLGQRVANLSRKRKVKIGHTAHPLYGMVNMYHESILQAVFATE